MSNFKARKIRRTVLPVLSLPEVWAGGLVTDREVKLYVVSDVITPFLEYSIAPVCHLFRK